MVSLFSHVINLVNNSFADVDLGHDEVLGFFEHVVPGELHGFKVELLKFVEENHFSEKLVSHDLHDVELLSCIWNQTSQSTLKDHVPVITKQLGGGNGNKVYVDLSELNRILHDKHWEPKEVVHQNRWVFGDHRKGVKHAFAESELLVVQVLKKRCEHHF